MKVILDSEIHTQINEFQITQSFYFVHKFKIGEFVLLDFKTCYKAKIRYCWISERIKIKICGRGWKQTLVSLGSADF